MWPTPAAADGERKSEKYCRGNPTLLGAARKHTPNPDNVPRTKRWLNPKWVAQLMGAPDGWLDVEE
jgi:hypothetical protein